MPQSSAISGDLHANETHRHVDTSLIHGLYLYKHGTEGLVDSMIQPNLSLTQKLELVRLLKLAIRSSINRQMPCCGIPDLIDVTSGYIADGLGFNQWLPCPYCGGRFAFIEDTDGIHCVV